MNHPIRSLNIAAEGNLAPRLRRALSPVLLAACVAALGLAAPATSRATIGYSKPSVTPPPGTAAGWRERNIRKKAAPGPTDTPTPVITVLAYTGEQDPDEGDGADYLRFFTPETTDNPFLCEVTPPFDGPANALQTTGLLSLYPNAVIEGLTQPSGEGMLGFLKPGVGGITSHDNVVMLIGDLQDSQDVDAVAQTGTAFDGLPEGVTINQFLTMDGLGPDPFFLAIFQGTGITAANSLALCTFNPTGLGSIVHAERPLDTSSNGALYVLLQKGDSVSVSGTPKPVKTFTTLVGSPGTLAQGRWRCVFEDEADTIEPNIKQPDISTDMDWIGVRLTFTDNSEGIYAIPGFDNDSFDWEQLLLTGPSFLETLPDANIVSFGLPAFGDEQFAVLAYLTQGVTLANVLTKAENSPATVSSTTVTAANNVVLINGYQFDEPYVLSRKGDPVLFDANDNELTGVTIAGFGDPVVGGEFDFTRDVAFMVTLAGMPAGDSAGIMYSIDGDDPFLLANAGAAAVGTTGHWASFPSMVLPDDFEVNSAIEKAGAKPNSEEDQGPGPIFEGILKTSAADGINASNNLGLWAVDGFGELILLLQTGQQVTVNDNTETIKTFVTLVGAPGSVGAASTYDQFGNVSVVAYFYDGSSAILNIAIPLNTPPPI